MITRLENVTLVTPARLYPGSAIDVEGNKIAAVHTRTPAPLQNGKVVDCQGNYAMPGFVDIHMHGGGKANFFLDTAEKIKFGCEAHAQYGTTTMLPTTATDSCENLVTAIKNIR